MRLVTFTLIPPNAKATTICMINPEHVTHIRIGDVKSTFVTLSNGLDLELAHTILFVHDALKGAAAQPEGT
jgi:hypothetical protein